MRTMTVKLEAAPPLDMSRRTSQYKSAGLRLVLGQTIELKPLKGWTTKFETQAQESLDHLSRLQALRLY